jgi:hypothetical protein
MDSLIPSLKKVTPYSRTMPTRLPENYAANYRSLGFFPKSCLLRGIANSLCRALPSLPLRHLNLCATSTLIETLHQQAMPFRCVEASSGLP